MSLLVMQGKCVFQLILKLVGMLLQLQPELRPTLIYHAVQQLSLHVHMWLKKLMSMTCQFGHAVYPSGWPCFAPCI
jgi:hypothetical protein